MECSKCGTDNMAGALFCDSCGEPLDEELDVTTGSPSVAPAPLPKASVFPAPAGLGLVCKLVESGKVADKEFEIPEDDFEFSLGRPDLEEGIIPDIDLTKFGEKVEIEGKKGYTFSRQHAILSRRMSRLYLKALAASTKPRTMVQKKGGKWEVIAKDQEVELNVGDRFRLGGTEGAVIFEVN